MKKHILLTGCAGFIGSHLAERLLSEGYEVTGIDNFDPFYSRSIKEKNMSSFIGHEGFHFFELDILNVGQLNALAHSSFDAIIHLAAKAGVRPSIEHPAAYREVNIAGTQNLLEFAKNKKITQFIFGSSSSVYGINSRLPWVESDGQLQPISPYAGTKISAELFGHIYSYLYNIRFIALRFFTVYGPRQRPDLAIHQFCRKIIQGEPILMFGDGNTGRDYTYVSDIVDGILAALSYEQTMYEVINLGNHQVVLLKDLISSIEEVFNKKATIIPTNEQSGDVPITHASIEKAFRLLHYHPRTSLKEGLVHFRDWLLSP